MVKIGGLKVRSFKEQSNLDKNNILLKSKNISIDDWNQVCSELGMENRYSRLITPEEADDFIKRHPEKIEQDKRILFYPNQSNEDICTDIEEDMKNLASHEAGTKWMRIGTLVSLDPTQQMIGAGFKALIDQNKILIKQNELLRRQNEEIIKLLNNEE